MNTELTDKDIQNHLAQCDYLIATSTSAKVVNDAKETRKAIKAYQLQRNAKFN